MDLTINVSEARKFFKKWSNFIVLLTVLGGITGGLFSYFRSGSTYTATNKILVLLPQGESTTNPEAIAANNQMLDTYREIILSDSILNSVIKTLNLDIDANQIREKITVEKATESMVFNISYSDSEKIQTQKVLDEITKEFKMQINNYITTEETKLITKGDLEYNNNSKNILKMIIVGLLTGFCLAMGISLLIYFIKNYVNLI